MEINTPVILLVTLKGFYDTKFSEKDDFFEELCTKNFFFATRCFSSMLCSFMGGMRRAHQAGLAFREEVQV